MTQISWEILKKRSEDYYTTAEVAESVSNLALLQNVLENLHLALELSMKAVIAKNGGTYPDFGRQGHDLERLIIIKYGNPSTSILAKIKMAHKTSLANIGLSAWSMDCRYKQMENIDDMKDSINDYKGLYKWISDELLK